jgi:hypothetical protein
MEQDINIQAGDITYQPELILDIYLKSSLFIKVNVKDLIRTDNLRRRISFLRKLCAH